jgi:glycerophosphoryl diester phosphodiesterase
MDHRFAADAFPLIVAHRGASSTHPENTLPAFEAAIAIGAQAVELDVRLSADGVAVVMHDPDVSRTTDGIGGVHELTADDLGALNAGSAAAPAHVPRLAEVLELASGRAAVALEIKNLPGEPAYEVEARAVVTAALGDVRRVAFRGPVLVISFDPRAVETARRADASVATGLLTTELVDPDEALAHVVRAGHDLVLPGSRALRPAGEAFVSRAHVAGVRVGTWTVDEPEEARAFLEMGVDAVASNDPAMALEVLAELGR